MCEGLLSPNFKPHFGFILSSNYSAWGIKSLVLWTGISRYEYFEFSYVLSNLPLIGSRVLDVGSGHSLLPGILSSLGYEVIAMDLDSDAMCWQKKQRNATGSRFEALVADTRFLPFKQGSFDMATAISSLEHIRGAGDSEACQEIAKSLRCGGYMIVTVPGSRCESTLETEDDFGGIPVIAATRLRPVIRTLFRALGVDRNNGFFERSYSVSDAMRRCVPSTCVAEQALGATLAGDSERWIHRVLPVGTNALIEWVIAHFMVRIDLSRNKDALPGSISFLMR